MIDELEIERVADLAKRYKAERARFAKWSTRGCQTDLTQKQHQKINAELGWSAVELLKLEIQLHVACVDAGLADLRQESHYAPRTHHASGWHKYNYTPELPRQMKAPSPSQRGEGL